MEREFRSYRRRIPVGLEQVLFLAASDPEFSRALFEDREGALAAVGLKLRGSELAIFKSIPDAQLRSSINAMDTSGDNVRRRTFLKTIAASVAAVGSAQLLSGCDDLNAPGWKVDAGVSNLDVGSTWVDAGVDAGMPDTNPPDDIEIPVDHLVDMGADSLMPDMPAADLKKSADDGGD